jgi:hypothetical protein
MAIDTRNKRASAVNVALPFGRVAPDPDASLAVAPDRQQMGYVYAAALAIIEAAADYVIRVRSVVRTIQLRRHVRG